MEYKSNNNIVYSCKYHVVWCPKYRRKVLIDKVKTRLKELIEETCSNFNIDIIEMEIMPDHVHLLIEVDSTALQSSLKDLDLAFKNFFRRVKKSDKKVGYPHFKSKKLAKNYI